MKYLRPLAFCALAIQFSLPVFAGIVIHKIAYPLDQMKRGDRLEINFKGDYFDKSSKASERLVLEFQKPIVDLLHDGSNKQFKVLYASSAMFKKYRGRLVWIEKVISAPANVEEIEIWLASGVEQRDGMYSYQLSDEILCDRSCQSGKFPNQYPQIRSVKTTSK